MGKTFTMSDPGFIDVQNLRRRETGHDAGHVRFVRERHERGTMDRSDNELRARRQCRSRLLRGSHCTCPYQAVCRLLRCHRANDGGSVRYRKGYFNQPNTGSTQRTRGLHCLLRSPWYAPPRLS